MRYNCLFIFLFFSSINFAQIDQRLSDAKERLSNYKATYYAEDLTREQENLIKIRLDKKLRAEKSLLNKDFIIDSSYCTFLVDSIVSALKNANPIIPSSTEAFVFKSTDFNAFTMGEDILFIHSDLIYETRNKHELALVIAHEIAHNILNHAQNDMIRHVKFMTNDSIEKEMRQANSIVYGRATALNELLIPFVFKDKEISRQNEFSADSLGMSFILNSGFNGDEAIELFDIMNYYSTAQSGKMEYTKLPESVKKTFLEKEKSYTRENSLGFTEKVESELDKYLTTHPYSDDRFQKLENEYKLNQDGIDKNIEYSPFEKKSIYLTSAQTAFELGELSKFIYYNFENFELENKDSILKLKLSTGFYILGFLKERFLAGKYLDRQSLNQPEDYDRVCYDLNTFNSNQFYSTAKSLRTDFRLTDTDLSNDEKMILILELTKLEDKDKLKIFWMEHILDLKKTEYLWFIEILEEYLYSVKRYGFVKQVKPNK